MDLLPRLPVGIAHRRPPPRAETADRRTGAVPAPVYGARAAAAARDSRAVHAH